MNKAWLLAELDFVVAWEQRTGTTVPAPLAFTTDISTANDYARAKIGVRERLPRLDPDLMRALSVLITADVWLGVHAWDGRNHLNIANCRRMIAGRVGDQGVLVEQRIGRTHYHSQGFVITACNAVELPGLLLRSLPQAGPGRLGRVRLGDENDMDLRYGSSRAYDDGETDFDISDAFHRQPIEMVGNVEVRQGSSAFGPRGIVSRWLTWYDLVFDGRYLVPEGSDIALPAEPGDFLRLLNAEVAQVVRAIDDERGVGGSLHYDSPGHTSRVTEDSW